MSNTCKTCRWFISKDESSSMNFCRRFPPVPVHQAIDEGGKIGVHFSFAAVSGNNFCGEHSELRVETKAQGEGL